MKGTSPVRDCCIASACRHIGKQSLYSRNASPAPPVWCASCRLYSESLLPVKNSSLEMRHAEASCSGPAGGRVKGQ